MKQSEDSHLVYKKVLKMEKLMMYLTNPDGILLGAELSAVDDDIHGSDHNLSLGLLLGPQVSNSDGNTWFS